MEDLAFWLNDGKPERVSKFLNQRLKIGEEYIGIYRAVRRAENRFDKTIHYSFYEKDGDFIFDSKNKKIAETFAYISFDSRVSIKKVFKEGKMQYEVVLLNTLEDEKIT